MIIEKLHRLSHLIFDTNKPLAASSFRDHLDLSDGLPLMQPWIPVSVSVLYLVTVLAFNPKDNTNRRRAGPLLKMLGLVYNLSMTFFSFRIFQSVFPIMLDKYNAGKDFSDVICESSQDNWDIIGFCSWLFYLSKYYEFFDTVQIIARRRVVIFLQYFHHAGAVLTMWGLVYTSTPAVLIFTSFNSFIHTGMYFYYLITGLGVKVPFPVKMMITASQISQFFVGTWGIWTILNSGKCTNEGQLVVTSFTGFYVLVLIGLFVQFMMGDISRFFQKSSHTRKVKSL